MRPLQRLVFFTLAIAGAACGMPPPSLVQHPDLVAWRGNYRIDVRGAEACRGTVKVLLAKHSSDPSEARADEFHQSEGTDCFNFDIAPDQRRDTGPSRLEVQVPRSAVTCQIALPDDLGKEKNCGSGVAGGGDVLVLVAAIADEEAPAGSFGEPVP